MDLLSPLPATVPRRAALQAAVFATGLAGIVAEYVMATLASYLLGNAVRQWTLIISLMLFAMGLGSRLSRLIREHLADAFVAAELALSLLVASSAPLAYSLASWWEGVALVVYAQAFAIGLMIGLELPLATRLNECFEELRVNVSSVFEKDYYGALAGGLLFAFVALPHLGLTYTPIILGGLNFLIAAVFFVSFRSLFTRRRTLAAASVAVLLLLAALAVYAEPIVLWGEQRKYRDRVIYAEQTPHQRIVLTRWKNDHWLYLDGNEQFSSYDEALYHEPLVHPAMALAARRARVLVLGGGDGLAVREILAYRDVERIDVVDLDPAVTSLARRHPVLVELNRGALDDPRVRITHRDALRFLEATDEIWDVMVIDLPDPKTVSLARLYSRELYELAARQLSPGGVVVTQAGSPFFARRAYVSIWKTISAAGLVTVPYHNHVPTLGEWGWVLGVKPGPGPAPDAARLRTRLAGLDLDGVPTRFLNRDAMLSMLHFGKGIFDDAEEIEVSDHANLAVYYYYRDGAWDLF